MPVKEALYDYVIDDCVGVEDDVFAFAAFLDPQKEGKQGYEGLAIRRIVHYFAAEDRWEWYDMRPKGVNRSSAGISPDGTKETLLLLSLNEFLSFRYGSELSVSEGKIPVKTIIVPTGLRFIGNHFFAAGTKATIVRRDGPEEWTRIHQQTEGVEITLEALDGYAEDDIYVAGIDDDYTTRTLFHFDGKELTLQTVPEGYEREGFYGIAVCCAPDGTVYVIDRNGGLIAGSKDERWRTLIHPKDVRTNAMFDMVWFKGDLYATSPDWLYRFEGDNWVPINPDKGYKPIAWGFVSANDNVLLAAGPFGASIFDGDEWRPVYAQVTLEEIAVRDALQRQVDAVKDVVDMVRPGLTDD